MAAGLVIGQAIGGIGGFGPGIAGYKSWIVAFIVLLLLAWLARWTLRPARRAGRTRQGDGPARATRRGRDR